MKRNPDGSVTLTCIEHGCPKPEFTLSSKDIRYYREREWELPKRCPPCRDHRRSLAFKDIH